MGFKTDLINKAIIVILVITVLFTAYSEITPDIQEAGNSMNDSNLCADAGCAYNDSSVWLESGFACAVNSSPEGNATACDYDPIPLSGLFGGRGVVLMIIMAALAIFIIRGILKNK